MHTNNALKIAPNNISKWNPFKKNTVSAVESYTYPIPCRTFLNVLMSIPTTVENNDITSPIVVLKHQDNKIKDISCSMLAILLLEPKLIMNSLPANH